MQKTNRLVVRGRSGVRAAPPVALVRLAVVRAGVLMLLRLLLGWTARPGRPAVALGRGVLGGVRPPLWGLMRGAGRARLRRLPLSGPVSEFTTETL